MDEITRINHVGIRVKDLATTRAFYEKLGFTFVAGPLGPEPVAIMEHPSGISLNFILNASPASTTNVLMDVPEKHPGYTHMALEVTDIAAVEQKLAALAIPLSGRVTLPHGAQLVFVRDPDGNVIEFHQPPR